MFSISERPKSCILFNFLIILILLLPLIACKPTETYFDIQKLLQLTPPEAYEFLSVRFGEPITGHEQEDSLEAEYSWLIEDKSIIFKLIYFEEDDGSFSEHLMIIHGDNEDGNTNQRLLNYFQIDRHPTDYYVLVNPSDLCRSGEVWVSPYYLEYDD